jgi:hypothetical protein
MEIKQEDIGHRTRLFKITSIEKSDTFNICIGLVYDYEGKDRYNVYKVQNDVVTSKVGYYEVEKGTEVVDSDGDFNVLKFGEPTWTDKREKEPVKTDKPVKPPVKPPAKASKESMFEIIDVIGGGDCFFGSVDAAITGKMSTDGSKLRNELADYFNADATAKQIVIDYYKGVSHPDEVTDILKNAPSERGDREPFLNDYFDSKDIGSRDEDKDKSEDQINDEIMANFTKHLKTKGVWATAIIVGGFMKLKNIQLIFMKHKGDRVEDLEIDTKSTAFEKIDELTRYVILDYDEPNHYQLIVQKPKKSIFLWSEVPDVIKQKLTSIKGIKWPALADKENVEELDDLDDDTPTKPATEPEPVLELEPAPKLEPASKPVEPAPAPEPAPEPVEPAPEPSQDEFTPDELKQIKELEKKTVADLKAMVKEHNPDAVVSKTKKELAECVIKPKKCESKKKGKKGGSQTRKI